jgi:hypothetical protein
MISPLHKSDPTGDFDPVAVLKETVVDPIFTPINPAAPVEISDGTNDYDQDDIIALISNCLGDAVDANSELAAKALLATTISGYSVDTQLNVDSLFISAATGVAGLPEPDGVDMVYTYQGDVIDASADYLKGDIDGNQLFCQMAWVLRPDTLGIAFRCRADFDEFKSWMMSQVNAIAAAIPPDTVRMFSSFEKSVDLTGLTESMWLRKSAMDGNDELSFPRMLMSYLMEYAKLKPNQVVVMPFSLNRLLIPESLVLLNIDAHAHAKPREIKNDWKLIKDSLDDDIRVLRPSQIQKLTAFRQTASKMASAAVSAGSAKKKDAGRVARIRFKKQPPQAVDIARTIAKLVGRMSFVNHSQNATKNSKMSFARPSRRNPDDFNLQGRVISTRYRPDIHLYVDTSGSISEAQYRDAVITIIRLVRKLDVNLYFNSFSHVMSTSTFLPTKGRSAKQIWYQVQRIPKVTGWTDYAQIWDYVLASKKRQRELSLVITDFEYMPPTKWKKHPKNLYYLPISTTQDNWKMLVSEAQSFANAMRHIEPNIRARILA